MTNCNIKILVFKILLYSLSILFLYHPSEIKLESILFQPAFLSLHGVLESDSGDYSCRVDYKLAPTRYQAISLKVIGN